LIRKLRDFTLGTAVLVEIIVVMCLCEVDILEEEIVTKHSKEYRPIDWLDISGRSI
jgi:hypothetical protein